MKKNQKSQYQIWKKIKTKIAEHEAINAHRDCLDIKEFAKDFAHIVKTFLIPDNINPNNFIDNWIMLTHGGSFGFAYYYKEDIDPTPSIEKFFSAILDRPKGYPDWFLVAYPDVATWAVEIWYEALNRHDDSMILSLFSENIFSSIYKDDLVDRNGRIKHKHLRALINKFCVIKNKNLECSIIK